MTTESEKQLLATLGMFLFLIIGVTLWRACLGDLMRKWCGSSPSSLQKNTNKAGSASGSGSGSGAAAVCKAPRNGNSNSTSTRQPRLRPVREERIAEDDEEHQEEEEDREGCDCEDQSAVTDRSRGKAENPEGPSTQGGRENPSAATATAADQPDAIIIVPAAADSGQGKKTTGGGGGGGDSTRKAARGDDTPLSRRLQVQVQVHAAEIRFVSSSSSFSPPSHARAVEEDRSRPADSTSEASSRGRTTITTLGSRSGSWPSRPTNSCSRRSSPRRRGGRGRGRGHGHHAGQSARAGDGQTVHGGGRGGGGGEEEEGEEEAQ